MAELAQGILILLALAVANGLFAMSEIAVVSSRTARLEQHADGGNRAARAALELARSPGPFLSTVQVGITLVGILTGAIGATTLGVQLGRFLEPVPVLAAYSGAIGVGTIVVLTTYLSLIIGELVPKRLALSDPEGVASAIARPMQALGVIGRPLVAVLDASTDAVIQMIGVGERTRPPVTEDEIRVMLRRGLESGTFEEHEQHVVDRAFQLTDRRVASILTPRPEIVWLDLLAPREENEQQIINSVHTRFPVCRGSLDEVVGIVKAKDLLAQVLSGHTLDLKSLLQEPQFVPESTPVFDVLEAFEEAGLHFALVMDEYGGLQGLVTTNDILDALVGDIPHPEDESFEVDRQEDGSWIIDGMLPVQEFRDIFQVEPFPGESRALFETVGGFVMNHLERIPQAGDRFRWQDHEFEVLSMDERRVERVRVVPPRRT